MSHRRFSPHPIYRNAPWPNSYLIHPLSIIPVELTCLVAYTNALPLCNQKSSFPIDRLAWLQRSLTNHTNSSLRDLWARLPGPTAIASTAISPIAISPTVRETTAHTLNTAPIQRRPPDNCAALAQPPSHRLRPIPTMQPAITCQKAHAKLSTVIITMKQVQQTAQAEASSIVSDILTNRPKELTIKSVNNPMLIRHTPESMGIVKKRVRPLVAEPAFSDR